MKGDITPFRNGPKGKHIKRREWGEIFHRLLLREGKKGRNDERSCITNGNIKKAKKDILKGMTWQIFHSGIISVGMEK